MAEIERPRPKKKEIPSLKESIPKDIDVSLLDDVSPSESSNAPVVVNAIPTTLQEPQTIESSHADQKEIFSSPSAPAQSMEIPISSVTQLGAQSSEYPVAPIYPQQILSSSAVSSQESFSDPMRYQSIVYPKLFGTDAMVAPSSPAEALEDPEVVILDPPPLLQTIAINDNVLFLDIQPSPEARVSIHSYNTALDRSARGGSNDPNNPAEWSEFYRLLRGFLDRQILLESNERSLNSLKTSLAKTTNKIWTLKDEVLVFDAQPCADGTMHKPDPVKYTRAVFSQEKYDKLSLTLGRMREKLFNHLTVLRFESENAKQRVENAVDEILFFSPLFSKIQPNDPVVALDNERDPLDELQLKSLRAMLDALFSFVRRKLELTKDFSTKPFWAVVETCIHRLAAAQLRSGDFADHIFLMNHLVHCSRTDEWQGSSLIQFPQYDAVSGWTAKECSHFCRMLQRLLSPTARSTILTEDVAPSQTEIDRVLARVLSPNPGSLYWIAEEDLIAHLKQFPFDEILCSILFIANDFSGLPAATPQRMKYGFAVCEQLLSTLLDCIPFFLHYKDLCRRLAELSVQIIRLIYFLVETIASKSVPCPVALIPGALEEIKSIADRCFLFVFDRIYRAPSLWQFLVHLPYNAINRCTARAVLVSIFNQTPSKSLVLDADSQSVGDWHNKVDRARLLNFVKGSSGANAEFILHVLSGLARHHAVVLSGNISVISLKEVFELAYSVADVREALFKPGREVISAICSFKPQFISHLIKWISIEMDHVGASSLYLFQELPLRSFCPTSRDMHILEGWLCSAPDSVPNRLAQLIISTLDWSMMSANNPATTRILISIVASGHVTNDSKYFKQKKQTSMFSSVSKASAEEVKSSTFTLATELQAQFFGPDLIPMLVPTPLAAYYISPESAQTAAPTSQWKTLLESLPAEKSLSDPSVSLDPVVVFPLLQTTDIGGLTSPAIFQRITLAILKNLVKNKKANIVFRILHDILPTVIQSNWDYPETDRLPVPLATQAASFMKDVVLPICTGESDSGWRLTRKQVDIPEGFITLSESIAFQCRQLVQFPHQVQLIEKIVNFWLVEISSVEDWWYDCRLTYLVDSIVSLAFLCRVESAAIRCLSLADRSSAQSSKIAPGQAMSETILAPFAPPPSGGFFSSLFGAADTLPPLTRPWLVLAVCIMSFRAERDGWASAGRMISTSADPLRASKDLLASNSRWTIRALSSCALIVNPDSLTCMRFWQLFFAAYFTRGTNLTPASKIFFAPVFMKVAFAPSKTGTRVDKLKDRLISFVEYFRLRNPAAADVFKSMAGWLGLDTDRFTADAMMVIDPTLQPHLLAGLMEFSGEVSDLWSHFDDVTTGKKMLDSVAEGWSKFITTQIDALLPPSKKAAPERPKSPNPVPAASAARLPALHLRNNGGRRRSRQPSNDASPDPELDLEPPKVLSSAPRIQAIDCEENANLVADIMVEVARLEVAGKEFVNFYHSTCRLEGLFTTLIPHTHINHKQVIRKEMRCNRPKVGCRGAASFVATIEVAEANQQKINSSKAYFSQIVDDLYQVRPSLVPPDVSSAALKLEKTFASILRFAEKDLKGQNFDSIARDAFFELLQRHISSASKYPPTKIALESSIRSLAPVFIENNAPSMKPLLHMILSGDDRATLVTQFFNPNLSAAEFVAMFKILADSSRSIGEEAFAEATKRFDVALWLKDAAPKKEEQQDLFKILSSVLSAAASSNPNFFSAVSEEALKHVSVLVAWQFPLHLNLLLQFLFDSLRKGTLAAHVWEVLLQLPLSTTLKAAAVLQIFNWMIEYVKTFGRNKQGQLITTFSPHVSQLTRLITALSSAACRRPGASLTASSVGPSPSQSEAASATLSALLNLFSIFLLPPQEYGVSWTNQDDLQHGFSFLQALVDIVNDVFLKGDSRVSTIDQLWRWWINQGIVSHQALIGSVIQQTLFELQSWVELPWHEASFETDEMLKEVMKMVSSFPTDKSQPYVTTSISIVCRIISSRASQMEDLPPEKIKDNLLSIYEFLVCIACSLPFPLGLPFDKLIKEILPFLPWHKLPPIAIASSQYTTKYILEYFNNQQERAYFAKLPSAGALMEPEKARSIAISSADIHEQMALRLFTCLRLLRSALCWPPVASETRAASCFQRMDHYALYIDLVMELCPRSFSVPFAADAVGDIFSSVGKLATVLYGAYSEAQSEEHQSITEHIMRMTARMISVLNADFNPQMSEMIQSSAKVFVAEFPSLALLLLRAASLTIISEKKQPPLLEECLEVDLLNFGDWNRAMATLSVPELGRDGFLDKCLEVSAIIVLHTYSLQVIGYQVDAATSAVLNQLLNWVNKLTVPVGKEWKMMLLWVKTTQLLFWYLSRDQAVMEPARVGQLENLANHIFEESKSRKGGGILGMIGLGERSNFPGEFRLAARLLSIFILYQFSAPVGPTKKFRRYSYETLDPNPAAVKHLKTLTTDRAQGEFKEYDFLIQSAAAFIANPQKSLADLDELLALIIEPLFKAPIRQLFVKR